MINRKAKGSAWEREIIHMLEADGFKCTRAAGSMGEWDIVAISADITLLVQAKCNGWGTSKERAKLAKFPMHDQCFAEIWRKDDNKPAPIIYSLYTDNGTWFEDNDVSERYQEIRAKLSKYGLTKAR